MIELIEQMPQGLDTVLGDGGAGLSGGRSNVWPLPGHC